VFLSLAVILSGPERYFEILAYNRVGYRTNRYAPRDPLLDEGDQKYRYVFSEK
jgi:hypothetical protein